MIDPRDQIWKAVYLVWYANRYNQDLAAKMVDRLKNLDDGVKVLVALTASGSAVAAWPLWSSGPFRVWWLILASTAAVLSIAHGSLAVPARLKEWLEVKRDFLQLGVELDTLRDHMQVSTEFDVQSVMERLESARARFAELEGRIPSDFFATAELKVSIQDVMKGAVEGEWNGGQ
jgi:hypothetical protein